MAQRYKMGIDIGTSSVAISAYALNDHGEPTNLIYLDEWIFGEPVSPGDFVLTNATRRTKRLMRRTLARKKARIQKLLHLASLVGVTPATLKACSIKLGLAESDDGERLARGRTDGVWRLRAEALDRPLSWDELFLVLLRIAKNRGYNGPIPKSTKSVVGNAITQSIRLREACKARTIGEALWLSSQSEQHRHEPRFRKLFTAGKGTDSIRGTYLLRRDVEDEFEQIINRQSNTDALVNLTKPLDDLFAAKGEALLRAGTDYFFEGYRPVSFADALRRAVFYQRPLPAFEETIGPCELIPSEKRSSTAQPIFQEYRLLETLGNLRWKSGKQLESLSLQQRELVAALLRANAELEFDAIYEALEKKGLMPDGMRLNFHTYRTSSLRGHQTSAAWKALKVNKEWAALSSDDQAKVITVLSDKIGDPQRWQSEQVRTQISDEFGSTVADFLNLIADEEGKLKRLVAYDLPAGRAQYGISALKKLASEMADTGLDATCALDSVFPNRAHELQVKATGTLPDVDELELRSPVVKRALRETRKAIIDTIERLGAPPTQMAIELMADMRRSLEQRREVSLRQSREESAKKKAAMVLKENGLSASPRNQLRCLLWEEQNHLCPYSGQRLSLEQALGSETQVEHILPKKLRTIGNRRSMLVLAKTELNQLKDDETPWGAAQIHPTKWDWNTTKGAVAAILKDKRGFKFKAQMILNPIDAKTAEADLNDFSDSQYSDTAWIGREVLRWARHLCTNVTVIRGQLTASLRRQWGLHTVLEDVRLSEGRHGKNAMRAQDSKERINLSEKTKTLFYQIHEDGGLSFNKRCDHRHHMIDAAVIGLATKALYDRELRRIRSAAGRRTGTDGADVKTPCPIPDLRNELIKRLTGYVVWTKPDRLINGRMFDEEPFSLTGSTLTKRGKQAPRTFNANADVTINHQDRHGTKHTKTLVKAEWACMRITQNGWELLTIEQFLAMRCLYDGKLAIPRDEKLIFKEDLIWFPKNASIYRVASFKISQGLRCVQTQETSTFEDLNSTDLKKTFGKLDDLKEVVVFRSKRDLARHMARR
jgi:CRISPR-associated endonuclease Csn1